MHAQTDNRVEDIGRGGGGIWEHVVVSRASIDVYGNACSANRVLTHFTTHSPAPLALRPSVIRIDRA